MSLSARSFSGFEHDEIILIFYISVDMFFFYSLKRKGEEVNDALGELDRSATTKRKRLRE